MEGWIKLHRKICDWEWFTEPTTAHLFIYLLLNANHEPTKWRGIDVPKGCVLTGRKMLSERTGISEQSVRTSLERLKSTSEITIKTYNKFSLITITKWNDYQLINQHSNQQLTSNQPATNHIQELKNDKKEHSPIGSAGFLDRQRVMHDIPPDWLTICIQEMAWPENIARDVWIKFSGYYKGKVGHSAFKSDEEWGAEWRTWYRKESINMKGNTNGNTGKYNGSPDKPTKDDRARAAVMRAAERLGFADKQKP